MQRVVSAGVLLVAILALNVATPGLANAQDAVADMVETHDGAMYRGVIIERRPDGSLVLLTPTEGTREFAAETVRYAGPAALRSAPDPRSPAPEPPAQPVLTALPPLGSGQRAVSVWFSSTHPATLIRVTAQGVGYTTSYTGAGMTHTYVEQRESLCAAPCVAELLPGRQIFGVELANGRQFGIRGGEFDLLADTDMHVTIRSRRSTRIALIVVGGLLALAGTAILLVGDSHHNTRAFVGGLSLAGVGTITALTGMGLSTYRAEATVAPHVSR